MSKKFLALFFAASLLAFCKPAEQITNPSGDPSTDPSQEVVTPSDNPSADPAYAKAAPELPKEGKVLATNPNVEKFLVTENYPDKDWSFTNIYNYYGGFNNKKYDENGNEDPNGKAFDNKNLPNSDKPAAYSIRWKGDASLGALTLHMEDKLGWSADYNVKAGSSYVDITNLVPNDSYTYKVTATSGDVMAEGSFETEGHLHQVFFKHACRNGRDLGGWEGLDGKHIKYRLLYRGGRMQSETIGDVGKTEAKIQNIGAQLDLRGKSDVLTGTEIKGLDFCAPVIEQGGRVMLGVSSDKSAEENAIEAAKTKQCFDFILKNVKAGKGVYFHCSLGRDRTGTLAILLLGLLGVREGDISKEHEVTYFAPLGYSVSSSEIKDPKTDYYFKNTRKNWVYSDVAPYFWQMAGSSGTFAQGVEKYLTTVAGVPQTDIDEFRRIMLE